VFLHSGQVCSAGARLLVQDELHDRFVDEVVRRAELIRLGGPFDGRAESGPLISEAHLGKIAAYVEAGLAEGAVVRCGGSRATEGDLAQGYFFRPTVLDECDTKMHVVQAEWGGFKQSGVGRELGQAGLAEYRETKHIWQNVRPEAQRWFSG
jgi:betaine-aldehyde dehydrogenase